MMMLLPLNRPLGRRHLLRLLPALPLLVACGGPPATPTRPPRVYFEAPTPAPAPTAGATATAAGAGTPRPGSTPAARPAGASPTARPVAPATLAAAAANLPPDAGQRASAEVFKPITGAAPPTVRRPAPTALLIPSIGLDGRIVSVGIRVDQNNNPVWETAAFAVGHHQGSANPGEPGNVILSGHISSAREGDIFRDLPKVQLGDGLILRTPERDYLYTVDAMETVLPAEVSVLAPTGEARAILITCVPDRVYSHRLIVSARQV